MPVVVITTPQGNSTWRGWSDTTASPIYTSGMGVWGIWTGTTYTSTITSTGTSVWHSWADNGNQRGLPMERRIVTAEEAAAEDQKRAVYRARQRVLRLEREKAQDTAEKLLLDNLNAEQVAEYKQHYHFTIRGRNNVRFRIRKGRSGNVDVINPSGLIDYRLCAHPAMDVPDCDTMLAQKIMLELDQDAFMRVANRHAAPPEHLRRAMSVLQ